MRLLEGSKIAESCIFLGRCCTLAQQNENGHHKHIANSKHGHAPVIAISAWTMAGSDAGRCHTML